MSPSRRTWLVALGVLALASVPRPADAFDPLQRAQRAVQRSRAAMAAGDTSAAIDEMLKAQALAPDDPRIRHALGEVFYEGAQYPSAGRVFEGLLREDAPLRQGLELDEADLLYNAANAAFEQQDLQRALELYTEAMLRAGPEAEVSDDLAYNLELTQALLESQQSQDQDSSDPNQDQQDGDSQEDSPQQDQQQSDEQQEQPQDQQSDQQSDQQPDQQEDPASAPPDSSQSQSAPDSSQSAAADSLTPPPEGMTAQEALRLLEALDHDEEQLRQSIQRRLRGGESEDDGDW